MSTWFSMLCCFLLSLTGFSQGFEGKIIYEHISGFPSKRDSLKFLEFQQEINRKLKNTPLRPLSLEPIPYYRQEVLIRRDTLFARNDYNVPFRSNDYYIQIGKQALILNAESAQLTSLSGPNVERVFDDVLSQGWRDSIQVGKLFKRDWPSLRRLKRQETILGYRCTGYLEEGKNRHWGRHHKIFWIAEDIQPSPDQMLAVHFDMVCSPYGIVLGQDHEGFNQYKTIRAISLETESIGPLQPRIEAADADAERESLYRPLSENHFLEEWEVLPGATLPDLHFKDISRGEGVLRLEQFLHQDKFVLIEFWGTWCYPCHKLLPFLKELHALHQDRVTILALNYRDARSAHIKNYIEQNDLQWPQGYATERIVRALNPGSHYPAAVLLDENGLVLHTGNPLTEWDVFLRLMGL